MIAILQRPEISIFLITAVGYLIGFLIYGGYLSAFAGSMGNTPFALTDLSLIDLIAILPIAIITTLSKAFQALPRVLVFIVVYVIAPVVISIAIYVLVGPKIYPPWSDTVRLLAGALWIGVEFFSTWKNTRYRSWQFVLNALILLFSAFLYGICTPTSQGGQSSAVAFGQPIINFLLGLVIIVFALLLAFAIGILTAEVAVEKSALSRVSRLVLAQPIPALGETTFEKKNHPTGEGKHWLIRLIKAESSIPKTVTGFIYEPAQDHPIFLVSSFRSFTLFYIPQEPSGKTINGKVVTVLNGLVYSIEMSVQRK